MIRTKNNKQFDAEIFRVTGNAAKLCREFFYLFCSLSSYKVLKNDIVLHILLASYLSAEIRERIPVDCTVE